MAYYYFLKSTDHFQFKELLQMSSTRKKPPEAWALVHPDLAKFMKGARERHGLTQRDVAAAIGCRFQNYHRYEKDGKLPRKYFPKLPKALKTTVLRLEELRAGDPEKVYDHNVLPLLDAITQSGLSRIEAWQFAHLHAMFSLSEGKFPITPEEIRRITTTILKPKAENAKRPKR